MSPSDIVGPSPVTSNGTETTEIEDDATEEVQRDSYVDSAPERHRSEVGRILRAGSLVAFIIEVIFANEYCPQTLSLATDIPENVRQGGEEAVSVIHAPENFSNWVGFGQVICTTIHC